MNIINQILQFFGISFKKKQVKPKSQPTVSPVKNLKEAKQKAQEFKEKNSQSTVITVSQLISKIRNNIYFLENLILSLNKYPKYLKYEQKVQDLKRQSEDSLRIALRIDKDAPYYKATMKSIIIHTNSVSKVVNIPY